MRVAMLIEGYASLFGVADLGGDVIRAGAFARALRERGHPPMLLQHHTASVVGRWTRIMEDGRGLFVRGLVERGAAQRLIAEGLDGLSIGFRARTWTPRIAGGRYLIDLDLVEISLVAEPMLPGARFTPLADLAEAA